MLEKGNLGTHARSIVILDSRSATQVIMVFAVGSLLFMEFIIVSK